MTTPSKTPGNDGNDDCFKLEKVGGPVSEGSIPKPVGHPSRMTGSSVVSGVCRLSTISEQEPDKMDTGLSSQDPLGGSEWGGSSFSLCSDNKYKNSSSRFSTDDSYQPDSGDDCAAILLACLHCRFHDLVVMVPDACEMAISHCFPSYNYIKDASSEKDQQGRDCFSCNLDCSFWNSCQDTAELLELAMEISEVCYR